MEAAQLKTCIAKKGLNFKDDKNITTPPFLWAA